MYTMMKSQRDRPGAGAAAYRQTEVAEYADFNEAIGACRSANQLSRERHYLLNDSGKELYAETWID